MLACRIDKINFFRNNTWKQLIFKNFVDNIVRQSLTFNKVKSINTLIFCPLFYVKTYLKIQT